MFLINFLGILFIMKSMNKICTYLTLDFLFLYFFFYSLVIQLAESFQQIQATM